MISLCSGRLVIFTFRLYIWWIEYFVWGKYSHIDLEKKMKTLKFNTYLLSWSFIKNVLKRYLSLWIYVYKTGSSVAWNSIDSD